MNQNAKERYKYKEQKEGRVTTGSFVVAVIDKNKILTTLYFPGP